MVHPWPLRASTWTTPPSITLRTFPAFLCFLYFLRTSRYLFLPLFVWFGACVYSMHGTAGEPGAVAGVSGCWRVEGGLDEARSPFSCLGVACPTRHEGSMNGLCLASWCGVGYFHVQSKRGVYFCDQAELHRKSYAL